jgi:hypothetical protein
MDDSYLPFLDDFEAEGSLDPDRPENKASSDYGSVLESEDFPSLSDFLTMQQRPPERGIDEGPQENDSNADPGYNAERTESPAEEDAGAPENEFTDYDQYISISDDVSATPGSGAGGGACGSSLYSTNATSTMPAVSPLAGAVLLNTDADSLFCSSGTRSHEPSALKRSRDKECTGNDGAVYGTPTKKPRILAQETTSPARQSHNTNPPCADEKTSVGILGKGEPPHKDVDDKENACNDIDLSLLDEYKDFVNFL